MFNQFRLDVSGAFLFPHVEIKKKHRKPLARFSASKNQIFSVSIISQSESEEKRKMKGIKVNMIYGAIVTAMTAVFGRYWFLFAGFLAMNVIDYITGWCKAKFYNKNESSAVGAKGILKKVWYWVVIGIAFFVSFCFAHMGEIIGIDLNFVQLFGWFTLASYLINEIRSILENLVEMKVNVPPFFISGLAITEKLLEAKTNSKLEETERVDEGK